MSFIISKVVDKYLVKKLLLKNKNEFKAIKWKKMLLKKNVETFVLTNLIEIK